MSIDPLRLLKQQTVTTRAVHYSCPSCGATTRDKKGTCGNCRRMTVVPDLTRVSLQSLLAKRNAINAELKRRADEIAKALTDPGAP